MEKKQFVVSSRIPKRILKHLHKDADKYNLSISKYILLILENYYEEKRT
jgi:hypothetical protein